VAPCRRSGKYRPHIAGRADIEIERARSAWQLIGATFALYRRYPWLFLALAAVVVVPYDAINLLIEVVKVLHGAIRTLISLALFVADFALVLPLISALHVHAVADVREGRAPEIGPVARRGVATIPVLSRAAGLAYVGVVLGLVALIVPGVILALRWAVVAQVATLEPGDWRHALEGSKRLTSGHYRHIFALFLIVSVLAFLPGVALNLIFGWHVTVAKWLISAAIGVPISSFTALTVGLLYYDLSARVGSGAPGISGAAIPSAPGAAAIGVPDDRPGDPLTPEAYTDEDRPRGWYIDPKFPNLMYYWAADGKPGWSEQSTRTPRRTLAEWHEQRKREGG
jgi:hypothetical protein